MRLRKQKMASRELCSSISYFAGEVGGLTDLTGAAAANGLLTGGLDNAGHAGSNQNINELYGMHSSYSHSHSSDNQGKI